MPTLRFEGATLDEAVQAAREKAGPGAKVTGASRVRRGGVAGFFAHEHIEVEVDVPEKGTAAGPAGPSVVPGLAAENVNPLEQIISEMAAQGPSSVLDLAEKVNALESQGTGGTAHRPVFSLRPAPDEPARPADPSFAAVLERIAREPGLTPNEPELGPPVHHDPVLLKDLDRPPDLGRRREDGPLSARPQPQAPPGGGGPIPTSGRLARSLEHLGLPPALCRQVLPAVNREGLEIELARALKAVLPPLPALPSSPASVMAVVGPPKHATATARALAAELGAPPEGVAIATQRKVWSRRETVISSPEAAAEQRRSWRWRPWPSVVVVEQPVRPFGTAWSASVLQALEPALCWGVAEAAHKPEDVTAWSCALGGLDVLALVDLEGTTTPASALTCPVPVGRLDGAPATAEAWASLVCSRLGGQ